MKKVINLGALVAFLTIGWQSFAHEGHSHAQQLDQVTAVEAASTKMMELINNGQLSSKWAEQPPAGAQLARVNGLQNWIVSYLDDSARERLELMFTPTGEFVSMSKTPIASSAATQ